MQIIKLTYTQIAFLKTKPGKNWSYKRNHQPRHLPSSTHDTFCSFPDALPSQIMEAADILLRKDYPIPQAVKNKYVNGFSWVIFTWIKRHTQVTNDDSQTLYFVNIITANPEKLSPTELAPVWCGSHSDIPSRLVDYLQFSFFLFTDVHVI